MSDFVTSWETLFGVYTPIEVIDQTTGAITVMTDWSYVMRCAFFLLVVFCLFRLLGGVLKHDRR